MTFESVLFPPGRRRKEETPEAPAFFRDLNLDQVIEAITAGREWQEYNLKPFFYLCPNEVDTITYRQEIMRDIEKNSLKEPIQSFAQQMRVVRNHLAQVEKLLYWRYQRERWFLDAVQAYCSGVRRLLQDLDGADLQSRGLVAFHEFLQSYVESEHFTSLLHETEQLLVTLSEVRYSLVIKGLRIDVRRYEGEPDYSVEIENTFAKFQQGAVKEYQAKFSDAPQNDHIQEAVLQRLARLFPEAFSALDRYYAKNTGFLNETIVAFDREIQFYIAYLNFIAPLKQAGLKFCYPLISPQSKEVYAYATFDLALASKLVAAGRPIISNDFYLKDSERVFVVTGANQGDKTTFARTFGQLHYLASIGCPVPGREAQLFLFDKLFTHFERQEDIRDLRGHLEDDLIRIHSILEQATPNSIIILNETFSSATLKDAIWLGKQVMNRIIELDALCIFVTFIDEFASMHPKVVSMVATVLPEDPSVRTFVLERRPADGLAYDISIARKYGLTYERLKERTWPWKS